MASHNDLYLRGGLQMNPTSTTPGPAVALDTLLRLTHQMHDMPFQYTFIDKPRAGTSAVIWHDPARPHWPSDGIRYLTQTHAGPGGGQPGEKFSTTTHSLPNNVSGVVELETGVISLGIFPPGSPAVPVAKDSPDLLLARFRIRWRIVTPGTGNLALWLVYWGRDERMQQRAPPGWEREPIRQYPLPMIPQDQPVQFPLRTGSAAPPQQLQLRHQPSAYPPAPPSTSTPHQSPPPQHLQGPPGQQQQPVQGKNKRSASTNQAATGSAFAQGHPQPPSQQQGVTPFNNARQGSMPALGSIAPLGQSHGPSPQHSVQHSRQGTPKQANATTSGPGRKGHGKAAAAVQQQATQATVPPGAVQHNPNQSASAVTAMAAAQMQAAAQTGMQAHLRNGMVPAAPQPSFPQPFNDPFDYLSHRSWSGLRYEHNHALIAPVFDATTTTELLETWEAPSTPFLEKIKLEIGILEKEVEALRLKTKQPVRTSPSKAAAASGSMGEGPSSSSLGRKASMAGSVSGTHNREKEEAVRPGHMSETGRHLGLDALLAPLPRMMPIVEMQDKAMQAHNARRKEIEEVWNAQRAAKLEKERVERERAEAEEAERRGVEEAEREAAKQAKEEKEERRDKPEEHQDGDEAQERENEAGRMDTDSRQAKTEAESPTKPVSGVGEVAKTAIDENEAHPFQDEEGRTVSQSKGSEYFDDSYSLLMKNDWDMGNEGGYGLEMEEMDMDMDMGMNLDMGMNMNMNMLNGDDSMDESLFELEYMNQMG